MLPVLIGNYFLLENINLSFWSIWSFPPYLLPEAEECLFPISSKQASNRLYGLHQKNVIFNLGNIKKILRSEQQISYKAQSSHQYLLRKVISEGITHLIRRSQHL